MSMPPYELWLRGHADIRGWMLGTGHALSWLAPRAHVGERRAGVRAVSAERAGRQPRAVGAPGHRGRRRSDRRHQLVPRHGEPVPAVRSARAPSGIAARYRGGCGRALSGDSHRLAVGHPQPIHRKRALTIHRVDATQSSYVDEHARIRSPPTPAWVDPRANRSAGARTRRLADDARLSGEPSPGSRWTVAGGRADLDRRGRAIRWGSARRLGGRDDRRRGLGAAAGRGRSRPFPDDASVRLLRP